MNNSFYDKSELELLGLKSIGKNVLISRKVSIYSPEKISVGDNVRIDDFCILSGNISIGSYIHIAANCFLFGGISGIVMHDFSCLSSRCAVYAVSDDYSGYAMTNPMIPDQYRNVTEGKVIIAKHSIVGSGSTILPNVTIGEGCSIGSMSLVSKSLEPWGIYVGIPCKRIKERCKRILELEKNYLQSVN